MALKNPSATWYFNDWENDEKLKLCSLAAQGLWKRLICIAARSLEHGVVQIGSQNSGLPHGLALIASAVGRPPEEIAPLIDELLSSGTASRDRKGRIYCRKMVRAAALSAKRAVSGKKGADVTNGRTTEKEDLPQQTGRQTRGPSFFIPPNPLNHGDSRTDAARAAADPSGPPRAQIPDTARWKARLDGHRPWEAGGRNWQATWGLSPDSSGTNPSIPPALLREWKQRCAEGMAKARTPA